MYVQEIGIRLPKRIDTDVTSVPCFHFFPGDVCTYLADVYGTSVEQVIRRIMGSVMTNTLSRSFNVFGRFNKEAFAHTTPSAVVATRPAGLAPPAVTGMTPLTSTARPQAASSLGQAGPRHPRRTLTKLAKTCRVWTSMCDGILGMAWDSCGCSLVGFYSCPMGNVPRLSVSQRLCDWSCHYCF